MPKGKPRKAQRVNRDSHAATGIGQLRHVYKRVIDNEKAAFEHLVERGIAHPKYEWQADHSDKSWRWRRVR